MVATAMVVFTREVERAGWNLLEALDKENVDCSGLFFRRFEENDSRFFLVTEQVGIDPRRYRERLYEIVWTLDDRDIRYLTDPGIVLMNPEYTAVRRVRDRVGVVDNDQREITFAYTSDGEVYVFRMR